MTATGKPGISSVELIVGLEIHVELKTRSKMFTRAGSPAHPSLHDTEPNSLIDPLVLALPGSLPVMNREAIDMSMLVGLALNCTIASRSKWDRKSYYYPDLPKGYQISQYDEPLCANGRVELPAMDQQGYLAESGEPTTIGIIRAHLEEDAGKLLHEAPDRAPLNGDSLVDLNRAGTPLLEIVTAPDFRTARDVVGFARLLRGICRYLDVTEGVMQAGHMRFEPNINTRLTLEDGSTIKTPIVEIKNLNSFRSLRSAIDAELRDQPLRWQEDGLEMGPGMKTTRGWDDVSERTFVQREKEDAHDYRYFPDPDLPLVTISSQWVETVRKRLVELPHDRAARYTRDWNLSTKEAAALTDERPDSDLFNESVAHAITLGATEQDAARGCANLLLQTGARIAKEQGQAVSSLGITPVQIASIVALRDRGDISAAGADALFALLADAPDPSADATALAESNNLLLVRDDAALDAWCQAAMDAMPDMVAQIRDGNDKAIGRLIGDVMKRSAGAADAATVRQRLLDRIRA